MAVLSRYQLVDRALQSNAGSSVRAEDLGQYPDFFVDPVNTSTLEQNTNHLIYGRGGSGKTIMFGALNERINSRFPESKVFSFFYTATDFRSSPEFGSRHPTVKERTHAFFHSFIERLALDIFSLADSVLKKPNWLQSLGLAGGGQAAERERLPRLVLELLEASGYGADNPMPDSVATSRGLRHSSQRRTAQSAEFGVRLDPTGGRASFDAAVGAQGHTENTSGSETDLTYRLQRHFRPSLVRRLLGEVIDLLELDYIVIFIDEWISLADCQVEFAARLKQCLFNDRRIGVKIAADPYQAQFNNGAHGDHFRGFEIERDIFVGVDLDFPFRDPGRRSSLFAETLYKRLRHFEPGLDQHFGRGSLENQQHFLDTVFRSQRAFEELCAGAQGLCRDFHRLFQDAATQVNGELTSANRIDFEVVRQAILSKTARIYAQVADSPYSHALLYDVITPHIREAGTPLFILESRPSPVTPVVNELLTKRVIHSVDDAALDPSIRGRYGCFEIARSVFLDLMRAAEFAGEDTFDDMIHFTEASTINEENRADYLLDLSALGDTIGSLDLLICPACSRQFSKTEKAFEVRGMCPHCYADVPT